MTHLDRWAIMDIRTYFGENSWLTSFSYTPSKPLAIRVNQGWLDGQPGRKIALRFPSQAEAEGVKALLLALDPTEDLAVVDLENETEE